MEEHEKIELRSEDVREILGTPPTWIVRWGTVLAMLAVVALLWVSYSWKYADEVTGELTLVNSNAPVPLRSRMEGLIDELLVEEKSVVKQGEALAIMKSNANYRDIVELQKHVDSLQYMRSNELLNYQPPNNLILGEVAVDYASFKSRHFDYQSAVYGQSDAQKIRRINSQIQDLEKAIEIDIARRESVTESWKKTVAWLEERKALLTKREITQTEYMDDVNKRDQKRIEIAAIESQISEKRRDIEDLKFSKSEVFEESKKANADKLRAVEQSIINLKRSLNNWTQQYVLTAPISGMVLFSDFECCDEYIRRDDIILSILPQRQQELYARVVLDEGGAGKVMEGQQVNMKFPSYPVQQYGFVRGKVADKKFDPQLGLYVLKVALDDGLLTSRGYSIPFERNMTGRAEVITESRSVFNRLFDQFTSISNQS